MKAVLYPYNMGSQSAKALAEAVGLTRIKENGRFKHTKNHLVINFGNSAAGNTKDDAPMLNRPTAVGRAIDKLASFQQLGIGNVPIPEFTTDPATALGWVNNSKTVFVRQTTRGRGGAGIQIIKRNKGRHVPATTLEEIPRAPLYTALFPKEKEYRVHVFNGEVIDLVQKKKAANFEGERVPYIRSHDNGWVFAREGVAASDLVKTTAVNAVRALGLDFGAVDIAENKDGQVCVFEVNTAPGLEGTTVNRYAEAIVQYLKQKQNGQTLTTITNRGGWR